uniref:Uncharacterized protein n=1 Tax=Acrobeloides nanus TaxID=290746 RepID=A0A914DTI1_9BILA
MSTLHYLAFLSLVVISLSTNRTCKFGDGNQVDSCANVDYCYKYMINSTIKYGKGCDTDGICNNIGNNKCKCDSTVRDYSSPYINMICCCDSDNCD